VTTDSGHSRDGGKHLEVAVIGGGQIGVKLPRFPRSGEIEARSRNYRLNHVT
jgi:hypothetical protein